MARPWSHRAGACPSSQHGPCRWAGIFSPSPAWSWDLLGSRKVPAAKTRAAGGGPGGTASPPQPWCCIAAPCPAWLLKYCFYYFFSLFRHCHLSCWYSTSPWQGLPSRAGAVAASRGRGAAPRLWAARGAGLRGDDAQGLRPLPAGVGPGPPRGVLMSVWLWLNCELSETAGDSGSAPGS